jgi:phosphatidylserine decarboxylase
MNSRKLKVLGIIVLTFIIFITAFTMFFNRNPQRNTPAEGIISPASGRVIEVRSTENADIIFEKKGLANHVNVPEIIGSVTVVLIEMTPMDVHVQRSPITGNIIRMDHYDGKHKNALGKNKLSLVEENEKTVKQPAKKRK